MQLHPELGRALAANYVNDALAAARSQRTAKSARQGASAAAAAARTTAQAERRCATSSLGPALSPEAPSS